MPPGWSAWHTVLNADTHHYYYGYSLNNNGVIEGPYGDSGTWEPREYTTRDDIGCPFAPLNGQPCFYETDMLTNLATQELRDTSPEQPFYLQLDYTAPHGDFRAPAGPEPAPRHYDWFKGAPLPHNRGQGFDEGNVTDKPSFIREAPYLGLSEIHTYRVYYDKALESLRSIDDGVKLLIDTLGSLHRLRNTYVIFTSDNGFFYGEHRLLGGKFLAYEPSTHLPFLIRGPHIKAGTESGEIVGNIDVAPTILELAGVTPDKSVDGRSMTPFFKDPELRTLRPYLFESFVETDDVNEAGAIAEPGDQSRATALQQRAASRERCPPGRRSQRLAAGAAQGLRGDPPRPLQVHRLAGRREGALRPRNGPLRAQQPGPHPQLLPGPQLPPPRTDRTARGLRRPRLPRRSLRNPADAPRTPAGDPPDQGRTARTSIRKKKKNRRKKHQG